MNIIKTVSIFAFLALTCFGVNAIAASSNPNSGYLAVNSQSYNVQMNLIKRLQQINTFKANYIQQVKVNNSLEQQSSGIIRFDNKGDINLSVKTPNPLEIISNSKVTWVYNPFIQQVTVSGNNNLNPFYILVNSSSKFWQNAQVSKNGNNFIISIIKPTSNNISIIKITIYPNGDIENFSYITTGNIVSTYNFFNTSLNNPLNFNFNFVIPKDTTISHGNSLSF
ncbi:MAG: outer membrane lipoprotein chaperone LolA [Psittacicella sp.]